MEIPAKERRRRGPISARAGSGHELAYTFGSLDPSLLLMADLIARVLIPLCLAAGSAFAQVDSPPTFEVASLKTVVRE